MATTIPTLPPAPSRANDTPEQFSNKADALLGALSGFVTAANAQAGENNTAATNAAASAASAGTSASSATASASSATASQTAAAISASAAEAFAQQASGTAISSGTANTVAYLDSNKYLKATSDLTYNGSQLGVPAGTVTTPSLTTTGDTNTGLYFPAADTVAIATGGVKRVEVDANGNFGLGVTPSSNWATSGKKVIQLGSGGVLYGDNALAQQVTLGSNWTYDGTTQKYIATAAAAGYQQNAGTHAWFTAPSGTAGNAINFTQAMTLDASGNLIIGATSAAHALHVARGSGVSSFSTFRANGSTSGALYGQDSSNNAYCWNESNAVLLFGTNNTERARITSDGNLLVGSTSNTGERVQVIGSIGSGSMKIQVGADGNNGIGFRNAAGTPVGSISVNTSSTAYNTSSDYRLKENIQPMTGALAKVAQLKPCTYKWKVDGSDGQGFIAHELQTVIPDCVTGEKDEIDAEGNPKYQGIDTSFLVATLTAALQEQQALIDAQKTAIESLTARIAALEAK